MTLNPGSDTSRQAEPGPLDRHPTSPARWKVPRHEPAACPTTVLWLVCLAGASALLATFWDDGWHTVRGRDSFFIPPHILLYASISAIGVLMSAWIATSARTTRGLRAILDSPALSMAIIGVAITLASAPIDDVWHRSFGRDSVFWSPPHMLGIVGTVSIGIAVLMEASRPGRGALLQAAAGALVLGSLWNVVLEYETEVPQFALLWYLPVSVSALMLWLYLVDTTRTRVWSATHAAVIFEGLRGAIAVVLVPVGFPAGVVPIVLPSAILFSLARKFGLPRPLAAALSGLTFVAIQVPYLRLHPAGFDLTAQDATIGAAAAIAGAALLAGLLHRPKIALLSAATSALFAVALFTAPERAVAHDPGQGAELLDVGLVATINKHAVAIAATILEPYACGAVEPVGLVARRAGETIRSGLRPADACTLTGTIALPDRGLWFVYVEANWTDHQLEAWLPIHVDAGEESAAKSTGFYQSNERPVTTTQVGAGVVLYAVAVAVFLFALRAVNQSPRRSGDAPLIATELAPAQSLPHQP
jgi:hypothetical protein